MNVTPLQDNKGKILAREEDRLKIAQKALKSLDEIFKECSHPMSLDHEHIKSIIKSALDQILPVS